MSQETVELAVLAASVPIYLRLRQNSHGSSIKEDTILAVEQAVKLFAESKKRVFELENGTQEKLNGVK